LLKRDSLQRYPETRLHLPDFPGRQAWKDRIRLRALRQDVPLALMLST
jgi:hypothetical protein